MADYLEILKNEPDLIRGMLKMDEFELLLKQALGNPEIKFDFQFMIRSKNDAYFLVADSKNNLVSHSGIFEKVFNRVTVKISNSTVKINPETNLFEIWCNVCLVYESIWNGKEHLDLAEMRFENGNWKIYNSKDSTTIF